VPAVVHHIPATNDHARAILHRCTRFVDKYLTAVDHLLHKPKKAGLEIAQADFSSSRTDLVDANACPGERRQHNALPEIAVARELQHPATRRRRRPDAFLIFRAGA